jgi:hypothetical protein
MLLTTHHICVLTGTASKGKLVRLGHFNWHAGVLSHRVASVTLGVSRILPRRPQPVAREISQWRAHRGMDRKKARMNYHPGNSSQNVTIRRAQGLRAAGEVHRGVQRQEERPEARQGVGFVHSSPWQDVSLEAGEGANRLTKHAQATRCRKNDGSTLANLPASDTQRVSVRSPVRANRTPGSVRGALGNRRPYLDISNPMSGKPTVATVSPSFTVRLAAMGSRANCPPPTFFGA